MGLGHDMGMGIIDPPIGITTIMPLLQNTHEEMGNSRREEETYLGSHTTENSMQAKANRDSE